MRIFYLTSERKDLLKFSCSELFLVKRIEEDMTEIVPSRENFTHFLESMIFLLATVRYASFQEGTPPKSNMSPESQWFERCISY